MTPFMTEAEVARLPRCERCGARLTRPASRVIALYAGLHWACMTPDERSDLRALEAENRELAEDVARTDAAFARSEVAVEVRRLRERVRLGTL